MTLTVSLYFYIRTRKSYLRLKIDIIWIHEKKAVLFLLFLESKSFEDFMVALEIDNCISKRGKGKVASYLEWMIAQIIGYHCSKMNHFLPLLTIEKLHKDFENENIELVNIQKNTPLLHHHDAPQPRNHQRKNENTLWTSQPAAWISSYKTKLVFQGRNWKKN